MYYLNRLVYHFSFKMPKPSKKKLAGIKSGFKKGHQVQPERRKNIEQVLNENIELEEPNLQSETNTESPSESGERSLRNVTKRTPNLVVDNSETITIFEYGNLCSLLSNFKCPGCDLLETGLDFCPTSLNGLCTNYKIHCPACGYNSKFQYSSSDKVATKTALAVKCTGIQKTQAQTLFQLMGLLVNFIPAKNPTSVKPQTVDFFGKKLTKFLILFKPK